MKACDRAVSDCPCSTNPLENFSSEAPDPDVFLAFNSGWGTTHHPNPGEPYTNPDGYGYCTSTVSQEAADQCAANCQLENQIDNGNPDCGGAGSNSGPDDANDGGNHGSGQTFTNSQQQCSFACDDGGPAFTWTVAAGYARGSSQAEADNVANSLACQLAIAHRICPGSLDNKGSCADADYFGTVKAKVGPAAKLPLTWTQRSGNLPPGLDLDTDNGGDDQQSLTVGIIGHITAGASGDYAFVLRATDADGNFNERSYKITVLVVAACPANATPGVPYSFQMQTTGGTGPFMWQVTSGTLPPGLSMTAAGLITGTTTTTQAKYALTFSVLDTSTAISCTKDCTMYNQCPGSNILDVTFASRIFAGGICGCNLCAGNQNTMTYGRAICSGIPEFCDMFYSSSGAFVSAINFTLRITVSVSANGVSGTAQNSMPLYKNGVFNQNLAALFTLNAGTQIVDVALTAGSYKIGNGGVQDTRISYSFGGDGTGTVNWTFFNKC